MGCLRQVMLVGAVVALLAHAQNGKFTEGLLNGRGWNGEDESYKLGYVVGFMNHVLLNIERGDASAKAQKAFDTAKAAKKSEQEALDEYTRVWHKTAESNLSLEWPDLSNGEVVKALDTFFAEPANLNITVSNALQLIARRTNGIDSDATYQSQLMETRKQSHSDPDK